MRSRERTRDEHARIRPTHPRCTRGCSSYTPGGVYFVVVPLFLIPSPTTALRSAFAASSRPRELGRAFLSSWGEESRYSVRLDVWISHNVHFATAAQRGSSNDVCRSDSLQVEGARAKSALSGTSVRERANESPFRAGRSEIARRVAHYTAGASLKARYYQSRGCNWISARATDLTWVRLRSEFRAAVSRRRCHGRSAPPTRRASLGAILLSPRSS